MVALAKQNILDAAERAMQYLDGIIVQVEAGDMHLASNLERADMELCRVRQAYMNEFAVELQRLEYTIQERERTIERIRAERDEFD